MHSHRTSSASSQERAPSPAQPTSCACTCSVTTWRDHQPRARQRKRNKAKCSQKRMWQNPKRDPSAKLKSAKSSPIKQYAVRVLFGPLSLFAHRTQVSQSEQPAKVNFRWDAFAFSLTRLPTKSPQAKWLTVPHRS